MKKKYLQPQTEVAEVELESMMTASVGIDSTVDPESAVGAESRMLLLEEALFDE